VKVTVPRRAIRVPGFRFAGVACGIKQSGRPDVALIVADQPATAAAVFTTNRVAAAPVVLGRQRLRDARLQAVVVNSGNANAYTGAPGMRAARAMTAQVAHGLGIAEGLVVPSSTGRIGVQLPLPKLRRGIAAALAGLSPDAFHDALDAIMTTDAFAKFGERRLRLDGRPVTVAVLAKGAGMIAPNMATLLVYVLTDARLSRTAARQILRLALPRSFNAIVVDGDMSTNDTLLLLANGVAGNRPLTPRDRAFSAFAAEVGGLLREVARMVVKDGEGATRVIDVVVRGARTVADAARVADAIARSPLCKTAFFGGDPYAGRVVCAAGYSGARFDPACLDIHLDDVQIVRRGVEVVRTVERRASRVSAKPEFTLTIDLHAGRAGAERMVSDLTVDYVRFNSDYRT
jgi:glutamate N-acetyltransferase/amino-acid N-acetyltransferase